MGVLSFQTGIFTSNVKELNKHQSFFIGDICGGVLKVLINRGVAFFNKQL
jgi:hypothetical protein